ncbi:MAG: type I methionyl aminopeptidase, partial [Candidatus Nealsonbacteria bacterium CG23_combo_of_CG06-09_8_20_14_all_36_12]
ELDKVAQDLVLRYGAKCSFKGYENFPACLCTSLNEEIVHAAPSDRLLKEGDI